MARNPGLKLAILGAGPIGLEAALYAESLGWNFTVYEQGQIGEFVGRWGHVKMFTPFGMNATPLGKQTLLKEKLPRDLPSETALQTGKEFRDSYLLPLANSPVLKDRIRSQTSVLSIGRSGWFKYESATRLPPFRLMLRGANNAESFDFADAVLDCTGTYARPNWLGDGGIPAAGEIASRPHIPYWPEDVKGAKKANYIGKTIAVIGNGHSACQAVCDLVDLANENNSTWVIWLTHGPRTQPAVRIANDPLKERDRLAVRANALATRCDGNLEHHSDANIEEVVCPGPDRGYKITAKIAGQLKTWDVEKLIANVGYKPDANMTAELRVGEPTGDIRTGEPNYFVLGAKSQGRSSAFLLADGHKQIRRAFAELQGTPKLNLYNRAGQIGRR